MEKRSLSVSRDAYGSLTPTSIALEPEFWAQVERIAARDGVSVSEVVRRADQTRAGLPFRRAQALRLYVLRDLVAA